MSGGGDDTAGGWDGGRIAMREFFADYQTADGYKIWAGKRFYQRKDIHIWDIYTLNNAGYGTGIEAIDIGMGNLNFAVTKSNDANDGAQYRPTYKLDARWNGIGLGEFGSLDLAVVYGLPWVSDVQKSYQESKNSGVLLTADYGFNGAGVSNHFIVQYGTNGFSDIGAFGNHAGDNYTPDTDVETVRLIDWGTLDAGNFGLGYSLIWSHKNSGENHGDNAWTTNRSGWDYSVVVRPEYKWTEYTRTTLELGYSATKTDHWKANADPNDGKVYEDPDVTKITLAQQFTPGKGFWTRPAIRFYVSYIGGDEFANGWDVGYKNKNKDGDEHQITVGTQVEAWW